MLVTMLVRNVAIGFILLASHLRATEDNNSEASDAPQILADPENTPGSGSPNDSATTTATSPSRDTNPSGGADAPDADVWNATTPSVGGASLSDAGSHADATRPLSVDWQNLTATARRELPAIDGSELPEDVSTARALPSATAGIEPKYSDTGGAEGSTSAERPSARDDAAAAATISHGYASPDLSTDLIHVARTHTAADGAEVGNASRGPEGTYATADVSTDGTLYANEVSRAFGSSTSKALSSGGDFIESVNSLTIKSDVIETTMATSSGGENEWSSIAETGVPKSDAARTSVITRQFDPGEHFTSPGDIIRNDATMVSSESYVQWSTVPHTLVSQSDTTYLNDFTGDSGTSENRANESWSMATKPAVIDEGLATSPELEMHWSTAEEAAVSLYDVTDINDFTHSSSINGQHDTGRWSTQSRKTTPDIGTARSLETESERSTIPEAFASHSDITEVSDRTGGGDATEEHIHEAEPTASQNTVVNDDAVTPPGTERHWSTEQEGIVSPLDHTNENEFTESGGSTPDDTNYDESTAVTEIVTELWKNTEDSKVITTEFQTPPDRGVTATQDTFEEHSESSDPVFGESTLTADSGISASNSHDVTSHEALLATGDETEMPEDHTPTAASQHSLDGTTAYGDTEEQTVSQNDATGTGHDPTDSTDELSDNGITEAFNNTAIASVPSSEARISTTETAPTSAVDEATINDRKNNAVVITLRMTLDMYTAEFDLKFRSGVAEAANSYCSRGLCPGAAAGARARRAAAADQTNASAPAKLFTAADVGIVPGYPVSSVNGTEIATYLLTPIGGAAGSSGICVSGDVLLAIIVAGELNISRALGIVVVSIAKLPAASVKSHAVLPAAEQPTESWIIPTSVTGALVVITAVSAIIAVSIKKYKRKGNASVTPSVSELDDYDDGRGGACSSSPSADLWYADPVNKCSLGGGKRRRSLMSNADLWYADSLPADVNMGRRRVYYIENSVPTVRHCPPKDTAFFDYISRPPSYATLPPIQ